MTDKALTGVRAKLAAHKEANSGTYAFSLKKSGIYCAIPKFINHGIWMKAQRIGKNDQPKTQTAYISEVVLFDGEKLTVTDIAELVPASDTLDLINEVFGASDDEKSGGDEGKAAKDAA